MGNKIGFLNGSENLSDKKFFVTNPTFGDYFRAAEF